MTTPDQVRLDLLQEALTRYGGCGVDAAIEAAAKMWAFVAGAPAAAEFARAATAATPVAPIRRETPPPDVASPAPAGSAVPAPEPPAAPSRRRLNLSPEERERRRQTALAMHERRRALKAAAAPGPEPAPPRLCKICGAATPGPQAVYCGPACYREGMSLAAKAQGLGRRSEAAAARRDQDRAAIDAHIAANGITRVRPGFAAASEHAALDDSAAAARLRDMPLPEPGDASWKR